MFVGLSFANINQNLEPDNLSTKIRERIEVADANVINAHTGMVKKSTICIDTAVRA